MECSLLDLNEYIFTFLTIHINSINWALMEEAIHFIKEHVLFKTTIKSAIHVLTTIDNTNLVN